MLHVHLDPLGGMAGDMFIAAVLDVRPDLEQALQSVWELSGIPGGWSLRHDRRRSKGLDARTFNVVAPSGPTRASGRYAALMERIDAMPIAASIRAHARGIYTRLGECEAAVHGIALNDVHFHELADWDSVIDILGAAVLIDALDAQSWSASAIPLGSGQVRTEHGPLPVPVPATAKLLEGMVVHQDGIPGERVTPTGAAILAHLGVTGDGMQPRRSRALGMGLGAGTRELDGCANVLRVQLLELLDVDDGASRQQLSAFEFEIDDQSPEDLATGLDIMRASPDVVDVFTYTGAGKKNRLSVAVRVLCYSEAADAVAELCFAQTTTLGVRESSVSRRVLSRIMGSAHVADNEIPVKLTDRARATTAKAEHDAVAALSTDQATRRRLSSGAETAALAAHETKTQNKP